MSKGKRAAVADELDLVPIMNLVTILIPFLLMAAQFVNYAVIDSTLPAIGPPTPIEEQEDEDEPLNLSIFITDKGFTVAGSAAILKSEGGGEEGEEKGPTIACKTPGCTYSRDDGGAGEAYDVEELRRLLTEIKDEYEDEQTVILVPEPDIPYEVLVLTMDASRENPEGGEGDEETDSQCRGRCLFPFVVIAGGVQQ
jgi:biopolymer transport protein ExbD